MLEDLKYVVDNSKYVHINEDKIDDFLKDVGKLNYEHWLESFDIELTEKEKILLVFVMESMNFCFWATPKWKIQYKEDTYTGSNALFYSIMKQVENNKNFLNIEYLYNLDKESFDKFFEGENICPLLDKRYENFKEVVTYIHDNDFYNELYNIKSDIELIKYITTKFKCYDDKSAYKGRTIHFNKRATLLANDLYYVSDTIRNNIGNVNNLGGCADYGIPRTFRDYGIMIYSDELANMIDNEIEIQHDSDMEIEIRANMLYIIELIKKKLKERNIVINSVELDNLIWLMGKRMKDRSNSHHTVTIYY